MGEIKEYYLSYGVSGRKCTRVLNGTIGSATMVTWYQGNFIGVLNRIAGSEAVLG